MVSLSRSTHPITSLESSVPSHGSSSVSSELFRKSWHVLQLVDVRSRLSPSLLPRRREGPSASASSGSQDPAATCLSYAMETMGCQMNVADSERMEGQLRALGYRRSEGAGLEPFSSSKADLVILNTCSIRDHAEQKVRYAV